MSVQLQDPLTEGLYLINEWQEWLRRNRYAPSTIAGYIRMARKLIEAHPGRAVEKLTAEDLERYFEKRGIGNTTYSTQLETLRSFFNWLKKHKRLVRSNPCAGVDAPPVRQSLRHITMPEEFARLCKAARKLRDLVVLHLLYFSGLRINELSHVRVGDLDFERRLLRIRMGKGTKRSGPRERWTVLHQESIRVVKLWLWAGMKLHPDHYLLGMRHGRRVGPEALRLRFHKVRVAAGLPPDVTPHTLRHGMIYYLKMHGVSIEVAANLVGHANMEITRRIYGRLTPTDMVAIYEQAVLPRATEGGR